MIDREKSLESLRESAHQEVWASRGLVAGEKKFIPAELIDHRDTETDDFADFLPSTAELKGSTIKSIIQQAAGMPEYIPSGAVAEISAGQTAYLRSAQSKSDHPLTKTERQELSDRYFEDLRTLEAAKSSNFEDGAA